tara:strand:- start:189 stop:854 length:666 start_codon:yes stop_codon:yes gene_type:complete
MYFCVLAWKSVKSHAKEFITGHIDIHNKPRCLRCCSDAYLQSLIDWGESVEANDYGIHLKNDVEKQIFANFFKQKQNKLEVLNKKIDGIKKRRLSVKLDKLRNQIQVMEKERCWQTIKNNRLYNEVKKVAMISKLELDEKNIEDLDEVFELYIEHGIHYNKKMNKLYMRELKGMLKKRHSQETVNSEETIENEIIGKASIIDNGPIDNGETKEKNITEVII